ncbi:hypothetical protein [Rubellicoccus peritrichatus]|uniref:Uncharacterized protein n=1 Tax=Rubellicoccus peritrichatus TaxID=3080537 RepID=A0AAQ3L653_9BACT|nr:hypothetical protein [Puniceicoccus sp. CR14]WOO39447.1 hypothetical protein RZN69_12555 [Puniceicoccus sp. CR14]
MFIKASIRLPGSKLSTFSIPVKSRIVEPEILDSLPQDHSDAISNRKDILLINQLQGSYQWIAQQLSEHINALESIIELGAGAGDLGSYLVKKKILDPAKHHYTGLDLWKRPDYWAREWNWVQEDMTRFNDYSSTPVVLGNLIIHQFEDVVLNLLGERLNAHAKLIIINEPLRSRIGLLGLHILRLKGLNYVTLNDGAISIRAGFRRGELPALLNLSNRDWLIEERETMLGCYRMVALRK